MEKVLTKKSTHINAFLGIVLIIFSIYYHYSVDMFLLCSLFLSAFCVGSWFKSVAKGIEQVLISIAVGLGIIGIIVYFLLHFGLGNEGVYLLILYCPIVIKRKKCEELLKDISNQLNNVSVLLMIVITIYVIGMMIYGSAPLTERDGDALLKHLPSVVYAAENGAWYRNVIEGYIYCESMVLAYTFPVIMYSLGAIKAISLINTFLFFLTFILLYLIGKAIYSKFNIYLLVAIYFTMPLVIDLATMMNVDSLSIFYALTAVMLIISWDKNIIWNRKYVIAFISGCALFSKLTIVNTIFWVLLILAFSGIFICLKEKKIGVLQFLKESMGAVLVFVFPFVFSVCTMWYRVGNPFAPTYNNIFNSPYVMSGKFVDPYDEFSWHFDFETLLNLVFHTSRNRVEGIDGELGIYLFFILLIPLAILIYKNKKFYKFILFVVLDTILGCYFTYNLRYTVVVFLLIAVVVIISLGIIINMWHEKLRKYVFSSIIIGCIIFNIYSFQPELRFLKESFNVNNNVSVRLLSDILKEVPKNKRVFSVNAMPYKAEYEGFFTTNKRYITYTLNKPKLFTEQYLN